MGGVAAGIVLALSEAWANVLKITFDKMFGDKEDDFLADLSYALFLTLLAYTLAKTFSVLL